ncbi:adenylate/guanylate cyclase domain-containing protein [Sorangium sp. So ce1128]
MKIPSTRFPSGHFSEIDTVHVHVDGGNAVDLVRNVIERLNHDGLPSRLTSIQGAIAGPQRQDLPPTYQSHTPGTDGFEQLEFFSTTLLLPNPRKTIRELKRLLADLADQKGIVIEVERVIGKVDHVARWSQAPLLDVIHDADVGFQRSSTLPIEVHYAIDIPKREAWQASPPLSLESLLRHCSELDIRVGGWFLFDKGGAWAYRSNMFAEGDISAELVQRQRDDLSRLLTALGAELGFECSVRALVEQSLGVWKTPLKAWNPPLPKTEDYKDVQDLARWEEAFEHMEKFWVVAPNFLGDVRGDVYQAMVRNFWKGVEYTYFLQSFADVQRLNQFVKRLSREVPFVYEHVKAVLLNKESIDNQVGGSIFQREYFIANPLLPGAQGYWLVRSEDKDITGGRLLKPSELDKIIAELEPLTEQSRAAQGLRIAIKPEYAEKSVARAVVYTDLVDSTTFQEQFGDDDWEHVLLDYDLIVANEVSKLGGEVAKNLGDGYLLIFEQAGDALRCAQNLQLAIRIHNAKVAPDSQHRKIPPHKIALDFGNVRRVMRAQGFDYAGKTLSRCARLIQKASGNQVLVLNTFRDNARAAFRQEWFRERTEFMCKVEFKGLEGSYEIWEFRWAD